MTDAVKPEIMSSVKLLGPTWIYCLSTFCNSTITNVVVFYFNLLGWANTKFHNGEVKVTWGCIFCCCTFDQQNDCFFVLFFLKWKICILQSWFYLLNTVDIVQLYLDSCKVICGWRTYIQKLWHGLRGSIHSKSHDQAYSEPEHHKYHLTSGCKS